MIRPTNNRQRGSVTLEAVIAVPAAALVLILFVVVLRSYFVYDAIDQIFFNSTQKMAGAESYAYLSGSDGFVEPYIRAKLLGGYFDSALRSEENNASLIRSMQGQDKSILIEEVAFDLESHAGTYELSYSMKLPGGLPQLDMRHKIRVRSLWQLEDEVRQQGESSMESSKTAYTTPHGRDTGVYHTDPQCWTLKRSWENPEGMEIKTVDALEGYRECYVCQKSRVHDGESQERSKH